MENPGRKLQKSIRIEPDIFAAALAVGQIEDRDFSGVCNVAVRDYARERGLLPTAMTPEEEQAHAEFKQAMKRHGTPAVRAHLRSLPRRRKARV